jgi:hypothetical protein
VALRFYRGWFDAGSTTIVSEITYKFTVKGRYPSGNKAKMQGIVRAEDGFPASAFEAAIKVCQELTPGLIVDISTPGQVVLRASKGSVRRKNRKRRL